MDAEEGKQTDPTFSLENYLLLMFSAPYPSTQPDWPAQLNEGNVVVVGPGVVVQVDFDLCDPPGDHPPLQVVPSNLDPRPRHLPTPGHAVRCSDHPLKKNEFNCTILSFQL